MSFLVVKIVLMKVEIVDEYDNYITVISHHSLILQKFITTML